MSRQLAESIQDIAAQVAPMEAYRFLGVSGAVTMTGFFVNGYNTMVGIAWSITIPVANGSNDPVGFSLALTGATSGVTTFNGGNIDNDIVGWVGTLSGAVYLSLGTSTAQLADFKSAYSTHGYPQKAAGTLVTLGRVA